MTKKLSVYDRFKASVLTDDARLLDLVVRLAAIAFLLDDLIEFRGLIRDLRIFLPAPLVPFLASLPHWMDWILLDLHVAGLALLICRPQIRFFAWLVAVVTAFQIFDDLTRLLPFVAMYGFTILIAALPRTKPQIKLQALRIMVIGIYFWGGFHKLNAGFYTEIFPWFISPIVDYRTNTPFVFGLILLVSLFVPFFEALIGIFLILKKTRLLGTWMAFVMLFAILACLGPWGHNRAVGIWPWNIYLFFTEVALFMAPHKDTIDSVRANWLPRVAAVLFVLAPAFGIWGLWNSLMSFKLYSGNAESATIILDKRERKNTLPTDVAETIDFDAMEWEKMSGLSRGSSTASPRNIFSVADWLSHINIGVCINEYVYRTGASGLCPYLKYPDTAILRIIHPEEFNSTRRAYTEAPLCPRKAP